MRRLTTLVAFLTGLMSVGQPIPSAAAAGGGTSTGVVTGSALYRERMALPPGAVFEAVLEDISRADAAARLLGRMALPEPGAPPYDISITYDRAEIDPARTYAVRARVIGPEGLIFTSDSVHPVLTRGAPDRVEIVMVRAAGPAQAAVPGDVGPAGLRLPASFTGTLPCADCAGIAHHLDLWEDGSFQLRRDWLGRTPDHVEGNLGRWSVDAATGAVVLHGTGRPPLRWQITGPDSLRALARNGSPIASDLPYGLVGDGTLVPVEVPLSMTGQFVYFADSAMFEHCESGHRMPVAMEGAYIELERAYLEAGLAPQAPLLAVIEGRIAPRPGMEGPVRRTVLVDRLIATRPGESCARERATAPLVNTYWKLERLGTGEAPVPALPDRREPHLVLHGAQPGEAGGPRFAATAGCNTMAGGYVRRAGGHLEFGQAMATLMACPPPVDALERGLAAALAQTRNYRVTGQTLVLSDAHGEVTALFRAVHLP